MKITFHFFYWVFGALCFFVSFPLWAAGPIHVAPDGTSSAWDGTVTLHPESGDCGDLTNAEIIDLLEAAADKWTSVSGVSLTITITEGSLDTDAPGNDVTVDNYLNFYVDDDNTEGLGDDLTPVIFDETGEITEDALNLSSAAANNVLGFAGAVGYSDDETEIVDGQMVINCDSSFIDDDDVLEFTLVHELGHLLGLDHSTVYVGSDAGDCDDDVDNDCDKVTMYPSVVDAEEQKILKRDDEVAILNLYGLANLEASSFRVTGTLLDEDGDPLRCADIQAQQIDGSDNVVASDVISAISGVNAVAADDNDDDDTQDSGECESDCGDFVIRGLDPAQEYQIVVRAINSSFTGSSSVSPCTSSQIDTIDTETIETIAVNTSANGGVLALGNVTTTSTGGTTETGDSTSSDAFAQNLACSLHPYSQTKEGYGFIFLFYWGMIFLFRKRKSHPLV